MTAILFLVVLVLGSAVLIRFVRNDRLGGGMDLRVVQAAHRVTAQAASARRR